MPRCLFLLLAMIASTVLCASAADRTFASTPTRTHLLELYTSEGCSSCPPAEKWISELRAHPRLWKDFVPVAFHVDYWDRLGWKDRFAKPAFTARQHSYAQLWRSGSVYTPAFVLNGREWRERSVPSASNEKPGVLTVSIAGNRTLVATFRPERRFATVELHVALLGLELQTRVRAGENRGRELRHEFVALSHHQKTMTPRTATAIARK
jgi:hypothetical protein